jgi:hypothetical protein
MTEHDRVGQGHISSIRVGLAQSERGSDGGRGQHERMASTWGA